MVKRRWFLIALILLAALGFYLKTSAFSSSPKEATYIVKRQDLKQTLSISGEIKADEDVTLRFQTSGYLTWVGVKEGDTVKKYQTIASLDQTEVEKNLQKYLQTYLSQRWTLDQTRQNYSGQAVTDAIQRIIDQAQFNVNSSVLDVEIKNLAIKYSRLWTPIDGIVVSAKSPLAGVNITPAQAEFEVVNPETIYFSATADQTDVVNIQSSQSGEITLDAYPDKTINGNVENIAFTPKSGETGTVYEIKLSLNGPKDPNLYRLGMTGTVDFVAKERYNVLSVPTKAIITEGRKKYVYLKRADKKVKTTVTTGLEADTTTEITSGLTEGDIVYD